MRFTLNRPARTLALPTVTPSMDRIPQTQIHQKLPSSWLWLKISYLFRGR